MKNKDIKILVADDEKDILDMIKYNLEKEGYKVYTASDGQEVLDTASNTEPDLVLLDIMMPKMNGIDVCYELRQNKKYKDTIIAFLTARDEDFSQISAFESGGDDFISKPIKPRVLLSRIKALLKRSFASDKKNDDTIIKLGNISINTEKISVKKNDEKIDLVKKEYELLTLLASKPGKVFTRQEILNQLWGTEVIVGNRTIDVHIRKLRDKIGDGYITTIKGIGYKVED